MGSIKQFAGQTVIYGIGSILSKVVYLLIVNVFLTYLLGEERKYEYGIYTVLYSYMTILIVLFSLKLDTALFRFGNKKEGLQKAFNTTISLVCISAIVVIAIVLLFSENIAQLLDLTGNGYYIKWLGFILAADIVSMVAYAKLRLENKAKAFALFKIFNVLLSSLLIVFFLVIYPKYSEGLLAWIPKYEYVVDYIFLTNLMVSILFLVIVILYVGGFKFSISSDLRKKIIPYVIPLIIVGMANNFIQYFGPALIKMFSSQEGLSQWNDSAIFESSRKIAGLLILFIGAFNYAAEPFFFNNSSSADKKEMYGTICSLFVLCAGFISIGLVLFIDLTQYLVGDAFRESLFIVPILLLAYIINGIYVNIAIWYKLSDKTLYGAMVSIIGAVVSLGFILFTIRQWGYVACAWASLLAYLIMAIVVYLLGQKHYPIHYPIAKIFRSVTVIAFILFLANYTNANINGLLLYAINLFILALFSVYAFYTERTSWLSILKKKI